jgi:hypothetical protein
MILPIWIASQCKRLLPSRKAAIHQEWCFQIGFKTLQMTDFKIIAENAGELDWIH